MPTGFYTSAAIIWVQAKSIAYHNISLASNYASFQNPTKFAVIFWKFISLLCILDINLGAAI